MDYLMRQSLIVIALLFAYTAVAGDFEDGMAAYQQKDYAVALAKFRSASLQGDRVAPYLIGTMYQRAQGVEQDYSQAADWFRVAAEQGVRMAQLNLGQMYERGHGVIQDYKEAFRWHSLAARQGVAEAQYSVGRMYGLGYGVLQDDTKAHMWFNIAAISGDKASAKGRDIAASKMTQQQVEQAQRMARECIASDFKKCD
jgi:TPR repeat protein